MHACEPYIKAGNTSWELQMLAAEYGNVTLLIMVNGGSMYCTYVLQRYLGSNPASSGHSGHKMFNK